MPRVRAVAIVVRGEQILLMHRVNYGKEYWVFPGGGVEAGETVEQAVARELREETSMEVRVEKLLYHHIYDDGSEQFFYLCAPVSGEPRLAADSQEAADMAAGRDNFYEPGWYDVADLAKLLLYPLEIRDWFLADFAAGFSVADLPRSATIKIADLREKITD